ncbi:hypothetical protein [Cribrihabitans marinus]|nr:hypothetical protein [Cribrihabitans marinus]GGH30607.1 hypothetical protein GCM10010973_20870 [Cribrihabitans marinus]
MKQTRTEDMAGKVLPPSMAPKPDCETAALLRASLNPIFDRSNTWGGLLSRLARKGYGLAFYGGRLVLTSLPGKERVCSDRFLGQPFGELVRRLGRPAVRPLPGGRADGELIATGPRRPA